MFGRTTTLHLAEELRTPATRHGMTVADSLRAPALVAGVLSAPLLDAKLAMIDSTIADAECAATRTTRHGVVLADALRAPANQTIAPMLGVTISDLVGHASRIGDLIVPNSELVAPADAVHTCPICGIATPRASSVATRSRDDLAIAHIATPRASVVARAITRDDLEQFSRDVEELVGGSLTEIARFVDDPDASRIDDLIASHPEVPIANRADAPSAHRAVGPNLVDDGSRLVDDPSYPMGRMK